MNPVKRKELLHLGLGIATIFFSAVVGLSLAIHTMQLFRWVGTFLKAFL